MDEEPIMTGEEAPPVPLEEPEYIPPMEQAPAEAPLNAPAPAKAGGGKGMIMAIAVVAVVAIVVIAFMFMGSTSDADDLEGKWSVGGGTISGTSTINNDTANATAIDITLTANASVTITFVDGSASIEDVQLTDFDDGKFTVPEMEFGDVEFGEVEVGMEAGKSYAEDRNALVRSVIIPNPHDDLRAFLTVEKDGTA